MQTDQRTSPQPAEFGFDLSGGRLCLDFANTVSNRVTPPEIERLVRYDDFVAFARQSEIVSEAEAAALRRTAAQLADEADVVLTRARRVREALFRIFFALATDAPPSREDLVLLNEALAAALARLEVVPSTDGFGWDWRSDGDPLDWPLWPIVRDAAELLVSPERAALRECASDNCVWLFLDRSKNQSRRWCDMKVCGNRSKVRRHYLKAKGRA